MRHAPALGLTAAQNNLAAARTAQEADPNKHSQRVAEFDQQLASSRNKPCRSCACAGQ